MNLIKTSILSGIATLIRVITGFFLNKIIAVYVGPAGLAYVGQFQNFTQFIMSFATGAINSGVVKYTAEHKDNIEEKKKVWSTALFISIICAVIASVLLIVFNNYLSIYLFNTNEYSGIFLLFAFTLIFFVFNSLLISILNGQSEIKKLTVVNIVSSLVTLILTGWLSYYSGVYGALLSLTLGQSVVFFITLFFVIKSRWFRFKYFFSGYDKIYFLKLSQFALMAIVSGITGPVSQIIVRNYIGNNLSWSDAGCWEGVTRISSIYLMMVTTPLSIYYLPKLSVLKNREEIKTEIVNGYKIIVPIVAIGAFLIYILRDYAVTLLFTKEFSSMSGLFAFQMTGDVIKISSWLLSYVMVAKAMTKKFIAAEIMFSFSFVIFSMLFLGLFGLAGVTYSYCLSYIFYFYFLYVLLRDV